MSDTLTTAQPPVTDAETWVVYTRPAPQAPEERFGTRDIVRLDFAEFAARTVSRRPGMFYAVVATSTGRYIAVFRNGEELGEDAALAAVSTPLGAGAMTAMQIPEALPAADQLRMVAVARRAWEAARPEAIAAARAEGMSWKAIGEELGMSPQGALQVHLKAAGAAA